MKEDMPAKTPYLIPRLGFPNTIDMSILVGEYHTNIITSAKDESCVLKHICYSSVDKALTCSTDWYSENDSTDPSE